MGWFNRSDDRRSTRYSDEQAVERYRYMLRTAPPEAIEQAHEEAFSRLTPEQRRMALDQLAQVTPERDRRYLSDDPRSLARLATRTEIRQPGMLERLFGGRGYGDGRGYGGGMFGGGMGMGMGMGGMLAGSLLASVAGSFIGSAIAENFFHDHPFEGAGFMDAGDQGILDAPDTGADYTESSFDESGLDSGGFDEGFGDIEL